MNNLTNQNNNFIPDFESDIDLYKETLDASNIGAPMFNKDDIFETKSILDRLLRYFFIKKKITRNRLKTASSNYDRFMMIESPQVINTNYSNIMKTIKGNKLINGLSFNQFSHLLSNILGYVIIDVKVTVKHVVTKETVVVSLKEVEEYIRDDEEK